MGGFSAGATNKGGGVPVRRRRRKEARWPGGTTIVTVLGLNLAGIRARECTYSGKGHQVRGVRLNNSAFA
ncbi:hypothetical protein R6Q59_016164 [Mikania micrantha]